MNFKNEWCEIELSQLGHIVTGKTPKTSIKEYFGGNIPFLTPSDNMDQRFITNTNRKLTDLGANSLGNKLIPPNSICISCIGSQLGKVVIAKKYIVTNQQINSIVPNDNINYMFLYYYMKIIGNKLNYLSKTSTAIPIINKTFFSKEKILLPSINIQIKIAKILSSLDNKIENNNKIISNIESQAQTIFKSWFIDFEPFEDEEFVESELGMIPKGWKVEGLGNSSLGKLIKSGIKNFEGDKIYLATADVSDQNINSYENKVSMLNRPSRANMQPVENSVWFAKMKDSRKLIYVGEDDIFLIEKTIFSTGFAGIKSSNISLNYLWTFLLSDSFNSEKDILSNGTTMQAINNSNINNIKIIVPTDNILRNFNNIVQPMFKLISNYKMQNIYLSDIRDTLLPKLMSGEIRVAEEYETETDN